MTLTEARKRDQEKRVREQADAERKATEQERRVRGAGERKDPRETRTSGRSNSLHGVEVGRWRARASAHRETGG